MTIGAKALCKKLIKVDKEEDVILLLQDAGYWDNSNCWRDLGDMENNFSTAGAQQKNPVAALVEKLVNAADARLMNECLVAGINPTKDKAPPSVRHAVAQLIEKSAHPEHDTNGLIENMLRTDRRSYAEKITLATTGFKSQPSITIVDEGEGQTPEEMPHTFMSLNKSNKLRVPFVQGRFNMGGTGVLRFCGEKRMQLIVTRRNPDILDSDDEEGQLWSFTVVRKENPTTGERNSVYRYLAPIGADPKREGGVLRFQSEELLVKPEKNNAYVNPLCFGSLVKLYEYKFSNTSHILRTDGLLRQVDVRLPSPALPMMFHECRDYKGKEGSYANPSTGLSVRLEDNEAGNLADGFPYGEMMTVDGHEFKIRYFGFKDGKAKTYLNKSEGILFVSNGQTQGTLNSRFYTRKNINFSYISDSLLTMVDCSKINSQAHEELFMNTREELADSEFSRKVISALEDRIGKSRALKVFNRQRRNEKIKAKTEDSKTMEDLLNSVMRKSPTLSTLFLAGDKLTDPTNPTPVNPESDFEEKEFPTYFHFKSSKPGEVLHRKCEKGREVRISFETDAENNYFDRAKDKGSYSVCAIRKNGKDVTILNHSMSLYNGTATLQIKLPNLRVKSKFTIEIRITDISRIEPFVNKVEATVIPFVKRLGPGPGPKPPPRVKAFPRLSLPHVEWVSKENWEHHGFNKYSALKVLQSGEEENSSQRNFDFFINEDNIYLQKELERAKETQDLLKKQFEIGLVLVGLALIHKAGEEDGKNIAERVAYSTQAIAMMLIPMISHLGDLDPDSLKAELPA